MPLRSFRSKLSGLVCIFKIKISQFGLQRTIRASFARCVLVFNDTILICLFPYILTSVITEAVPKKILELMNVPGLTRENVASHLQVIFF